MTPTPATQAGRDHIAAAEKRHEYLLDRVYAARDKIEQDEWADIIGEYGVSEVRDAVLAVEAEMREASASAGALRRSDLILALKAHGYYVVGGNWVERNVEELADAILVSLAAQPAAPAE